MKFSRALHAVLLFALIPPLLSCSKSKEDIVLAEFKDRKITLAKLEKVYAEVDPQYLPKKPGIEGLEQLLTTMLNKELMAYKADELGYDKDQTVIQGMEAFKTMGLQAGYLKIMVADKVKVKEEEVREHYDNKGTTLTVKVLLCDTPSEAEEAYQMLEDGADFESVCKQFSKSEDAPEGGRVVTAHYGSFAPNVQKALFSLPIGGFTRPVETPYGFHIMKVLSRTEARAKEPYEEVHDALWEEVRGQRERTLANELTDKIRENAGLEWYWDNFYIVFNAFPQDRSLTNPPRRGDEIYPLLYFEPEDMDKPLVSYNDVTITVKDFSDYYDRASFFARPRREFRFGGIRAFLVERVMSVLVPEEMEKSKIEEHPEIKAVMKAKREEFMVNRLYEDLVNQQTVATEKMIVDYYNDHKDFFTVPEKRRFGIILTGDIESAQEAHRLLQAGERFYTVARAYSIDEPTRENIGETELLSEGEQPEMDRVGFALKSIGNVSEPFETSRGWMILKLTERTGQKTFSLEEARDRVRSAIKQNLNEVRLNELLDKWKEELGVVMHLDNLEKADVEDRSGETAQAASEKTTG